MIDLNNHSTSSPSTSVEEIEAVRHLEQAITCGKHWYIALLEAIGLWTKAEENYNGRTYRYLIDGEAFDWLLLAERLCETVDSLLPVDEKDALIFYGRPPLSLSPEEVGKLIGNSKYRQYLNYFYGITVEGALILAVQEEVCKESQTSGFNNERKVTDEAYRRIYGVASAASLKQFRREKGYSQLRSISISELKEFAYWLFKYRLNKCEKARVASDTKKALEYLKRQWAAKGFFGALATDEPFA
ncbi:hypothetical protein ACFLWG_03335 [Chloroflexota bacterium]